MNNHKYNINLDTKHFFLNLNYKQKKTKYYQHGYVAHLSPTIPSQEALAPPRVIYSLYAKHILQIPFFHFD